MSILIIAVFNITFIKRVFNILERKKTIYKQYNIEIRNSILLLHIVFIINRKNSNNDLSFEQLFEFYGISTFVGYLMPNPFLYK